MAGKMEQIKPVSPCAAPTPAGRRHIKRTTAKKRRRVGKRLLDLTPPPNRYEGWAD